jgi:pyruvate/2-oxoglutarate dehydrogenase complex dihydrolipoamide acyltransferase (E2) component
MNSNIGPYQVIDFPAARRVVLNFLDIEAGRHNIYGLLEVDVTLARQFIEDYKTRTGERLSFTGYLACCLARAVAENKLVQAYLKNGKQLLVFDDVDIGMMIERQMGETRAPIGYVIRRANLKTFMDIHQEIRAVQNGPAPQKEEMPSWLRVLQSLPGPLRSVLTSLVRVARSRNPAGTWVAMAGTVGITAVGMFGKSMGWGLSPGGHTLSLIVGGIARKPAVVAERIVPRDILCLTVVFDHDVVDGAPAARFVRRLVELIESGYGLDEARPVTEPVALHPERVPA